MLWVKHMCLNSNTQQNLSYVRSVLSFPLSSSIEMYCLFISQAFAELQAKMIDTQQKVKLADLQIEQLSRMKKHANLTHVEITSLPSSTRMYEGVGRMYVSCSLWTMTFAHLWVEVLTFIDLRSLLLLPYRFILQSKDEINNQLTEKQKTADDKIKELEVKFFSHSHKWMGFTIKCCALCLNQTVLYYTLYFKAKLAKCTNLASIWHHRWYIANRCCGLMAHTFVAQDSFWAIVY